MSAQILDGKKLAASLKQDLQKEVAKFKSQYGQIPRLVNVMIGKDDGACTYANSQKRVAAQIGIDYQLVCLENDILQKDLSAYIQNLNDDPLVHGIMLHKPVPEQIDYHTIANIVDIGKDLEGINVANIGEMILEQTKIIPCTPASVMEHLRWTGINLRGKEVVIVGHSVIVGKHLSLLLLNEFATVTICHVATSESGKLVEHVSRADIVIVAVGRPALIKGEWIKDGAIVIDVGINQVNGKIVGDVEFETAKEKASWITPVPGGVGPVTVVMLMRNGIEAFKSQVIKQHIT